MANERDPSEDISGEFFSNRATRVPGETGPVEDSYCGNSTYSSVPGRISESVPGPVFRSITGTRPRFLPAVSACVAVSRALCCSPLLPLQRPTTARPWLPISSASDAPSYFSSGTSSRLFSPSTLIQILPTTHPPSRAELIPPTCCMVMDKRACTLAPCSNPPAGSHPAISHGMTTMRMG
jgi:hypothetical protein